MYLVYGPGIPSINPLTGSFVGGIRTDYGSFNIPRYPRKRINIDPTDESEEEEQEEDDDARRPSYPEKSYDRPRPHRPGKINYQYFTRLKDNKKKKI